MSESIKNGIIKYEASEGLDWSWQQSSQRSIQRHTILGENHLMQELLYNHELVDISW